MAGQYRTGWHHGIGRLGMLAVGLGIGAAVAAVGYPPGIASADPTAFDPNNFAVSIDGDRKSVV